MGMILLTVLLGYGLGKSVPRLVQRSGQLLLPWLEGIALVLQLPLRPSFGSTPMHCRSVLHRNQPRKDGDAALV
jgi:hypothetical protein